MKTTRNILTVVVLMAAVGLAMGGPVGFDFHGHGNGPVQSGDPPNVDGLMLSTQVDAWGTLPAANTSATQRQGTAPSGHTFTFNVGGAETISAWVAGTPNDLRRDYYYVANPSRYSGPVPWRIEGLTPGANHDLILFGRGTQGDTGPAQVYIPGHAGGAAATLDSEGDANFTGVVADGSGQINGFYDTALNTSASITGAQFEEVAGGGGGGGGALGGELGVLDLEANGGINPATGNPWEAGDQYRLAFLSSTGTQATSNDITTYNAFLQGLATTAGLGGGTWNVAASTAAVDARDNTSTNPTADGTGVGVFRLDSVILANDNADLWNGLADGLNLYEDGVTFGGGDAWTGSNGNGTSLGLGSRVLGGSTENPPKTRVGRSHVGGQWMVIYNAPSTALRPIYAISDPLTVQETGAAAGDIPEPATIALVGLAVAGLGGYVRKRKRS